LRGLPPDTTLVLVNGKRRHRAAVITLLGGGIADGAQGPDISTIPTIALKQVEVLRDGAAAQYGSDAIAGVINFELKDYAEGGSIEARLGQYFEGDGDSYDLAANWGLPLGNNGFVNLSFEYKESDNTSRSQQHSGAQALIDAGNPHRYAASQYLTNPNYASTFHPNTMIWGAPEFDHDYKFFANFGTNLSDNVEIYGHTNYAKRRVEGGFFYRNPHTRSQLFDGPDNVMIDGVMYAETVKVADLDGIDGVDDMGMPIIRGTSCEPIGIVDNIPVESHITRVIMDDNCESFLTRFPGGFVPRFGGEMDDRSLAVGVRGDLGNWYGDLSAVWGQHKADFFMRHTLNPQLLAKPGIDVANIPTDYNPGAYTETDYTINLDLSRGFDIGAFAGPVNVAFGLEYRQEEFEVSQGGEGSWFQDLTPGGLTTQGFSTGSNGFTGFGPRLVGTWSRDSYAAYVDLEGEITDVLTVGVAGRYEDHDDVGDTADFKLTARLQFTDSFAVRGAVSTGFRAPTVGQANLLNVTTAFTDGMLADEATLPPTHPASVLVGGKALTPEESTNYTIG
ncbi:MAG: TonB-dependent receptor plug domain-containing protein, partial [Pseudomonadales bacterium]